MFRLFQVTLQFALDDRPIVRYHGSRFQLVDVAVRNAFVVELKTKLRNQFSPVCAECNGFSRYLIVQTCIQGEDSLKLG